MRNDDGSTAVCAIGRAKDEYDENDENDDNVDVETIETTTSMVDDRRGGVIVMEGISRFPPPPPSRTRSLARSLAACTVAGDDGGWAVGGRGATRSGVQDCRRRRYFDRVRLSVRSSVRPSVRPSSIVRPLSVISVDTVHPPPEKKRP